MGVVRLPEELHRVIDREVAQGRASSASAFLQEAVMRLVDESATEEGDIRHSADAGSADVAAGRYTTVCTKADEDRLQADMLGRLRTRLAVDG